LGYAQCSQNPHRTTGGPSSQISIPVHKIVLRLRNSRNIRICMGKTVIFLSLKIRRRMNKDKSTLLRVCEKVFERWHSRFLNSLLNYWLLFFCGLTAGTRRSSLIFYAFPAIVLYSILYVELVDKIQIIRADCL